MKQGYAFQGYEKEKMARALGVDLPISLKHSTMVCNAVKGKSVQRAKVILTEAIEKKKAIPFTRYNKDKGHKTGIGPGRFVPDTCIEILKIINSAESNGYQKNLGDMKIIHICAQKASAPWHHGRQRRRQMKRAHIEVVVAQEEAKTKKKEVKKEAPQKEVKQETVKKPEVKEKATKQKEEAKAENKK